MSKRMLTAMVLCTLLTVVVSAANRIEIEDKEVEPGQQNVSVAITIDNDDPVWAVSFAARYPSALTFNSLDLGSALGAAGVNAEYFELVEGADYFGAGVVVDFATSEGEYDERALAAGNDHPAFTAVFDVDAGVVSGTVLTIDLRNDLGSPAVEPVFTVVPPGKLTETVVPSLVDGQITVAIAPEVTSIDPTGGEADQETSVTLTGRNFAGNMQVMIGSKALLSLQVVSPTRITGRAPTSATVGDVDVTVSNQWGSDTLVDGFSYNPPDVPFVSSITPKWGKPGVPKTVVVQGQNFDAQTTVTVGGVALSNPTFIDAEEIRGDTSATLAAGAFDVAASNQWGSDTLVDGFVNLLPPTITSITPSVGEGDELVTITGTNFSDTIDTVVTFGFQLGGNLDIISPTELTCFAPACSGATGAVAVQVTTTGGFATDSEGYNCGPVGVLFVRGDSNCDGTPDIADAIAILGFLFSSSPAVCKDALDVNDDGNPDIADAIYLLGYLFSSSAAPPAPFPVAGIDSTPDATDCASPCVP